MATVLSRLEQFYIPITRADPQTRTVEGYCFTTPTVKGDKWNLKRSALERASRKYMEMPAVRAMHGPVAAGKALSLHWDEKGCLLRAEIVDDNEWRKVEAGVYRGFSIGGRPLVARGPDVDEFEWVETSLVDRPCDPGALFTNHATLARATLARVADALAEADEQETPVYVLPPDASDEAVARVLSEFERTIRSEDEQAEHGKADNAADGATDSAADTAREREAGVGRAAAAGARRTGTATGEGSGASGHGAEGAGWRRLRGDAPTGAGSALRDAQAQSAAGTRDLEEKDEGGRMKDESRGLDETPTSTSPFSSFIPQPSSFSSTPRLQAEEEIERLESETSVLRGEAHVLREEAHALRGEAGALRDETARLQGALDVSRSEVTSLSNEVTSLNSEVTSLNSEVAILRGEAQVLRSQPLTRAVPVQYTALGLPREFAANEALRESALGSLNGAAQRGERRAQLVAQRQNLMAEAEAETDAARRTATVQRLLALEWELGQL